MQKKVSQDYTAPTTGRIIPLNSIGSVEKKDLLLVIPDYILHRQVSPSTAANYKSTIKNFIKGCDDITDWRAVQIYINELNIDKADVTANRQSIMVKDFLSFLDSHTEHSNDSWRKIKIRKYKYRGGNKDIISDEKFLEMYKLFDMDNINDIRDYAILKLLQSCGLRLSEPFNFRIKDIKTIEDAHHNKFRIIDSIQKGGLRLVCRLHDGTWDAIRKYLTLRNQFNLVSPISPDFIFVQHKFNRKKDVPMDSSVFAKKLKELFTAVGLVGSKYTAHSIRYTAAIKTLNETGDESMASKKLNHISPETIRYYTANYRLNVNAISTHNIEVNI
jgi:integrase